MSEYVNICAYMFIYAVYSHINVRKGPSRHAGLGAGLQDPVSPNFQNICIGIQTLLRNLDLSYAAFDPSRRDSMT